MIVKVATMQRDETLLLEPWLRYYGYLFGFENLHVHDNGSEDPAVLQTLVRYERLGVTVVYGPRDGRDFDAKGTLLAEVIRRWDAGSRYDFAFPVDCDEFIALREHGAVTCRRNAIHEYLGVLRDLPRTFKVDTNLFNVPALPGWYWPQNGSKTFFAARTLNHLDHGFHFGSVRSGGEVMNTAITYFHMHFKPWAEFVRSARAKLAPYVDVDDQAALKAYGGPNGHVQQQLLDGQEAYESRFKGCFRIHVPEFGLLLKALGETSALFDESAESLAIPDHAVTASPSPIARRVSIRCSTASNTSSAGETWRNRTRILCSITCGTGSTKAALRPEPGHDRATSARTPFASYYPCGQFRPRHGFRH